MLNLLLYFSCLILLVQALYFGYLFYFQLPNYQNNSESTKEISVVICGRNEAENILNFLPKFLQQEYFKFEVIFVNDRSTDKSSEILKTLQSSFANLQVIEIQHTPKDWNGKKWALKQGVNSAKYEYLLFTDADCYPESKFWISEMVKGFNSSNIVLGFGGYKKSKTFLNRFIQYETFMTAISMFGLAQKGINYMATGRNYGLKKSIYTHFEWGTNQNTMGGDDDLLVSSLKEKINIVVTPHAHTLSIPKTNFISYLKQKIRHISVSKKYSFLQKVIIGFFNFSSLIYYVNLFILFYFFNPIIGLTAIIFRTYVLFYIFVLASKLNIINMKFYKAVILDSCFILFLWIIGPISLLAKKIQWK